MTPAGAAGTVRVRPARAEDGSAWQRFVASHPDALPFHEPAWAQAVVDGFGHATPTLLAERAGRVVGVLPLVHFTGRGLGRLFGRRLVATGFAVQGGVLAADEAAAEALLAAGEVLARELGVRTLELRAPPPARPGWTRGPDLYARFVGPLAESDEATLARLRRKQRAMVRKAMRAGLQARLERRLDAFLELYADSVHRLGTPLFPRTWFEALLHHFGERADVLVVAQDGRDLAAVLSLYHRDTVMPYYAGSRLAARRLAANDFLYFALMRHARERGCTRFDFGRSKRGTGAFDFKRHWGFVPEPLVYGHYLPAGGPVPRLDPLSPRYRLWVAGWRRLPRPLADRLGPRLARHLG